jgi:hypothetical protein
MLLYPLHRYKFREKIQPSTYVYRLVQLNTNGGIFLQCICLYIHGRRFSATSVVTKSVRFHIFTKVFAKFLSPLLSEKLTKCYINSASFRVGFPRYFHISRKILLKVTLLELWKSNIYEFKNRSLKGPGPSLVTEYQYSIRIHLRTYFKSFTT